MGALGDDDVVWLLRLLAAAFFGILFTQSGLDKVVDRKGNLEYLRSVFANTPVMRSIVPLLLVAITLLETSAGLLSAAGFFSLLLFGARMLAFVGAVLASVAILCLFFGQRVAKDYRGAAGLVPYFLAALVAVALQGL